LKTRSRTVVEEEEEGQGEEEEEEEEETENSPDARRNGISAGQSANYQCLEGEGRQPETAALWHSHW
jgi:hypothetical protein